MSLEIYIFKGNDSGGPPDYAVPVAVVAGSLGSFGVAGPPPGGTRVYAVRTFDTATGLMETNTDARVSCRRDPTGADRSIVPTGPTAISARATAGGGVSVAWSYMPTASRPDPDRFAVYVTAGTTVDYTAAPTAVVNLIPNLIHYIYPGSGYADGTTYAVGVRSFLGAADDGNTMSATFEAAGTGPGPVVSLTGAAVYQEA